MGDASCLFCRIARGEIPSFKIHESEHFLAFLDLAQFTEGHTIAVPKDHFESIWDVPTIGEYFSFIRDIGNNFKKLGFQYVDTMTFGRMILHSHVHIVPHNGDDEGWRTALSVIGDYQHDPERHPSKERGDELVKRYSF